MSISTSLPRASRRPLPFLTLALVAAVACEDSVRYTQAEDEAAMALIASTWTEAGAGGLVLSLCEDVARSDAWEGPDCGLEHLVMGGGRSLEHSETHSDLGCGGCLYEVQAYVVGTLQGGALPAPVSVRGTIYLRSGEDEDPYALPWGFTLYCETDGACEAQGRILSDGSLEGSLSVPTDATPVQYDLTRTGDAVCP